MTEKQMTDEEIKQFLLKRLGGWSNNSYRAAYDAYIAGLSDGASESRKGMFTVEEVASLMRFYRGIIKINLTSPTAESIVEQYLTDRKGR